MAADPVCGMWVKEAESSLSADVRGARYYFCSTSCRTEFVAPEAERHKLAVHTAWAFVIGALIMGLTWFRAFPENQLNWIFLFLAFPVQVVAGWRFYKGLWHALKARVANMDTLIAVGTSVAFLFSVVVTVFPGRYGQGTYFETSVLIIAFILLGRTLEHSMKQRATEAVRKLLDIQPSTVRVLVSGKEVERPIEELAVGDVFVARPGDRIATDGVIVAGTGLVDEHMLTGESVPVSRDAGQEVFGGTINTTGFLGVRATRVGANTALAKIASLVERAQAGSAPVQRIADRVAAVFVPVVIVLSLAVLLGWWIVAARGFETGMVSAVAVLIVACPCAIGLATPAALVVATGRGASNGILVKSGEQFERASQVDVVLFDKTGTLTFGQPRVVGIHAATGFTADDVVRYVASAEAGSNHPYAHAVVKEAKTRGVETETATDFRDVAGRGVRARIGAHRVVVGTSAWLEEDGVDVSSSDGNEGGQRATAGSVIHAAVDGQMLGSVVFADEVRVGAREAVAALKARGIQVAMVTGDGEAVAQDIGRRVGIQRIHARVLPEKKQDVVLELAASGRRVAFVGDGINDAPALAAAHVGIAIGSGTDVTVEAADIVLVNDDPRAVVTALSLSTTTLTRIRQNLFWAFAYNMALIPVAAAGFLAPMYAGAAMALSSVSVVGNSLRLRRFRAPVWAATEGAPERRRVAAAPRADASLEAATEERDPVCGMTSFDDDVEPVDHDGKTYRFCSQGCADGFSADPRRFVGPEPGTAAPNVTFQG